MDGVGDAIDVLILRFDAPLMSFGGAAVDSRGVIRRFPARSMITGLLANALGWQRTEAEAHQRLQARVRFATRLDVPGVKLRDYQTVDLGQPHMLAKAVGWTTWGRIEPRGGASGEDTHIRERDYWADAVYTLALTVAPADEAPTLDAIEAALQRPARPLCIGRKPCVPSGPILIDRLRAGGLRAALAGYERIVDRPGRPRNDEPLKIWLDAPPSAGERLDVQRPVIEVTDERDWRNQIHGGRRLLWQETVDPPPNHREADDGR